MGVRSNVNWKTSGRTEQLDVMWNKEKRTADEIARKLRVSRGSVLAKIVRMGWCKKTNPFTEAETKKINYWWNTKGWSAARIARQLNVTKNKVVGKIHRMGWAGRVAGGRGGKDSYDLSSAPNNRFQWKTNGQDTGPLSIGKCATKIEVLPSDPPAHARKSFADNTGCMWPFEEADGSDTYCGCKKVTGKSYCADHEKRAHFEQPPFGLLINVLDRYEMELGMHKKRHRSWHPGKAAAA